MDLRPSRDPLIRLAAALLAAATVVLGLAAVALAAPEGAPQSAPSMRVARAPATPSGASAQGALPQSSVIDTTVASPHATPRRSRATRRPSRPRGRRCTSTI